MNLQELRKQPHLSASAINSYIDCSLAYKFSKIDKIPPEHISAEMLLGSAVHQTLQVFYEVKKAGDRLPLLELLQTWKYFWTEEAEGREDIEYKKGRNFQTMLEEGKSLLTTYYQELPEDNFRVLATEEAFSFNLEHLPIPIIGQIDLIEEDEAGTIIITDFKTSSKSYSSQNIEENLQLTLYSMAWKSNGYKDRDILLRFEILVKTKVPKYECYYTVRNEEDERRAVKKIIAVYQGIQSEIYIPNDQGNWKCGFCEFRQACEQWFQS